MYNEAERLRTNVRTGVSLPPPLDLPLGPASRAVTHWQPSWLFSSLGFTLMSQVIHTRDNDTSISSFLRCIFWPVLFFSCFIKIQLFVCCLIGWWVCEWWGGCMWQSEGNSMGPVVSYMGGRNHTWVLMLTRVTLTTEMSPRPIFLHSLLHSSLLSTGLPTHQKHS